MLWIQSMTVPSDIPQARINHSWVGKLSSFHKPLCSYHDSGSRIDSICVGQCAIAPFTFGEGQRRRASGQRCGAALNVFQGLSLAPLSYILTNRERTKHAGSIKGKYTLGMFLLSCLGPSNKENSGTINMTHISSTEYGESSIISFGAHP
ncbi:hypothetical protein P691DRAFT_552109 [Macrolepiota fuliginosa MF-IS2]|uniref:Uncharacterized protein n=1 Tax=Macrolepiota fuliginosa MF-IS2 TaxID=1400762 RepID=A0A9P6C557_9AGAR|nr:hypothetical protein P691DRAFT_552109 [Macrolepiota fuliginosa MF-IS2]